MDIRIESQPLAKVLRMTLDEDAPEYTIFCMQHKEGEKTATADGQIYCSVDGRDYVLHCMRFPKCQTKDAFNFRVRGIEDLAEKLNKRGVTTLSLLPPNYIVKVGRSSSRIEITQWNVDLPDIESLGGYNEQWDVYYNPQGSAAGFRKNGWDVYTQLHNPGSVEEYLRIRRIFEPNIVLKEKEGDSFMPIRAARKKAAGKTKTAPVKPAEVEEPPEIVPEQDEGVEGFTVEETESSTLETDNQEEEQTDGQEEENTTVAGACNGSEDGSLIPAGTGVAEPEEEDNEGNAEGSEGGATRRRRTPAEVRLGYAESLRSNGFIVVGPVISDDPESIHAALNELGGKSVRLVRLLTEIAKTAIECPDEEAVRAAVRAEFIDKLKSD